MARDGQGLEVSNADSGVIGALDFLRDEWLAFGNRLGEFVATADKEERCALVPLMAASLTLSMNSTEGQAMAERHLARARKLFTERVVRVAKPHALLGQSSGDLIAVKLNILTRKTLGGLETDLSSRVLNASGEPVPGLYAAGEIAGFGGGGMHGYRALEGTFLGGCIFSGRIAGRSAAGAV